MTQKILFLDRDGPVNIVGPKGFVCSPQHFHLTDGITEVCQAAQEKGYKIVVITNQTGVGLGDYTEDDMHAVHACMTQKLEQNGVHISDIVYSLTPESPYRKPSPLMFLKIKEKYNLSDSDMWTSVAIGDRQKDALAALRAGVGRIVYYQTDQILNEAGDIVSCTPRDTAKEIHGLTLEFQKLVIFGALTHPDPSQHAPQTPCFIRHCRPHLWITSHLKPVRDRL